MSKMSKTIAILGVVAGLGVAALPLSTYAAPVKDGDTGDLNAATGSVAVDTTIKLTVAKKLSIELSADTADLVNGAAEDQKTINVTVVTNNTHGYDLNIKGSTTAAEGGTLPTGANAASLVSATDYIAAGDLTGTTSTWGYKVAAGTGDAGTIPASMANWTAVTVSDVPIMSSTNATKDAGEVAAVTFGANIVDGTPAGEYVGKVTFTAADKTN